VGVVVDESANVVQFRGRTAPYLEPAPGMASLDLMRMLREGLLADVRSAFNKARNENALVAREGLRLTDGENHQLRLEVIPFKVPSSNMRFFLVLFEEAGKPAKPAVAQELRAPATEKQTTVLQQELGAVREHLQSVIEEQESTNEELKSANEEILSANEELQSTNEELQTAKEEAQSANEELATVNEELRHRNSEMTQVNNDLINLLSGLNIAIVMVSRDLRVRRFTPQATKVFNLIPGDVGRPLSDLKTNLQVRDFAHLVAGAIDTPSPYECGVKDNDGRIYCLRVRPYVTTENKIDGASIVLFQAESIMKSLQNLKTE
jgi:two-component system CheB/CheR fusion protein